MFLITEFHLQRFIKCSGQEIYEQSQWGVGWGPLGDRRLVRVNNTGQAHTVALWEWESNQIEPSQHVSIKALMFSSRWVRYIMPTSYAFFWLEVLTADFFSDLPLGPSIVTHRPAVWLFLRQYFGCQAGCAESCGPLGCLLKIKFQICGWKGKAASAIGSPKTELMRS